MEKKYFFFDIDGTLTDRSTGKIVPSAREALDRLEANGHFVAIATGRAHYKARKFTGANGFKNMVCCGGNGCVINNELVENIPLDKEGCLQIIHQSEELGYGWCVALDDTKDVYMTDDKFLRQVGKRKEPTRYIIDDMLDIDSVDAIYKIYVAIPKEEEEKLTKKELIGHLRFEPEYLMFYFQPAMMRQQISRDAHGSSSTMVKITHKDIKSWEIELPTLIEQKEYVDKMKRRTEKINKQLEARNQYINLLKEYKKSLIYEYVTGKKEVPESWV